MARANPTFAGRAMSRTSGKSRASMARESSLEPLSTTTVSKSRQVWVRNERSVAASRPDWFQLGITMETRGIRPAPFAATLDTGRRRP